MHDTTAWHWPAVPTSGLISLSSATPTSSPSLSTPLPTSIDAASSVAPNASLHKAIATDGGVEPESISKNPEKMASNKGSDNSARRNGGKLGVLVGICIVAGMVVL